MSDITTQWGPTLKEAAGGTTIYYGVTGNFLELEIRQWIWPDGWHLGDFQREAEDFHGEVQDFLKEFLYYDEGSGSYNDIGLRWKSGARSAAEAQFFAKKRGLDISFVVTLSFKLTVTDSEVKTVQDLIPGLERYVRGSGWNLARL